MSIKSTYLKIFIVGFSLFYLLSPLQTQVYELFHKISHQLSSESHENEVHIADNHSHNHDTSHEHKFLSSHSTEKNHKHSLEGSETKHTHKLLSFLSSVFNADDAQNNKEKAFFEVKLDKHILPNKSIFIEQFAIIATPKTWFYNLKTNCLELDIKTPPPKIVTPKVFSFIVL